MFHLSFGFRHSFDIRHSDFVIIQSPLRSAPRQLAEQALGQATPDISETLPTELVFCG